MECPPVMPIPSEIFAEIFVDYQSRNITRELYSTADWEYASSIPENQYHRQAKTIFREPYSNLFYFIFSSPG